MKRALVVTLAGFAAVIALVTVAYSIDMRSHRGRVARHVRLADRPVGGMRERELRAEVRNLTARYAHATVQVRAPEGGFSASAPDLGIEVSDDETMTSVMSAGRDGSLPSRTWRWATSFIEDRRAPVRVRVNRTVLDRVAMERDTGPKAAEVEPSITVKDGKLVAQPGMAGRGISGADIAAALPRAAAGGLPIRVAVGRGEVPIRFELAAAERVAALAEALVGSSLQVSAGGVATSIGPEVLRAWMRSVPSEDGLALDIDREAIVGELGKRLARSGTPPVEAGFVVNGDGASVTPSQVGTGCCPPEAPQLVIDALRRRPAADVPAEIPLTERLPNRTTEEAQQLQVAQPVASFTTSHPGGQPRVQNIHRLADLLRGQVIEPGQTFSINGFVGLRTQSNGFVSAPVIGEGNRFSEDVGGGISQFATTMFNAAFFAGMEIPEFQFHSIYISRYPFGRESTLAFPHPDLRVRNPSPYGVLIWTSYTDTDITVTLYSTKWVDADQTGQTQSPNGACTAVTTERTRRFVADGREVKDRFSGVYTPGEGTRC